MMKGIYPRGKGFQVKLKLPGYDKRLTGTFPTIPEAEAFILKAQANARLGKPIEDVKEAAEAASSGCMSI